MFYIIFNLDGPNSSLNSQHPLSLCLSPTLAQNTIQNKPGRTAFLQQILKRWPLELKIATKIRNFLIFFPKPFFRPG